MLSPYHSGLLLRGLNDESDEQREADYTRAEKFLESRPFLSEDEKAGILSQVLRNEKQIDWPDHYQTPYREPEGPPTLGQVLGRPALEFVADAGGAMSSLASAAIGPIAGAWKAAGRPDPKWTGEVLPDLRTAAGEVRQGWQDLGEGAVAGVAEGATRLAESLPPLSEWLAGAGGAAGALGLPPAGMAPLAPRLREARAKGKEIRKDFEGLAEALDIDQSLGTGKGSAEQLMDDYEHSKIGGAPTTVAGALALPLTLPAGALLSALGGDEAEWNRESVADAMEMLDIGMLTPGSLGAIAKLARGAGRFAEVVATQGPKAAKYAALNTAVRLSDVQAARVFAKRAGRTGMRNLFAPEHTQAFIDAFLDVTPGGGNPNAVAGMVERVGIAKTAKMLGWTDDQIEKVAAALGNAKPSDFGVRISRATREAELARETLLGQVSTLDAATEIKLVKSRARAATVLPERVPDELVGEATAEGLKVMPVDNVMGLPVGHNRVRVVYDPEILDSLYRAAQQSPRKDLRSSVAKTKDAKAWLRRMVRKDPLKMAYLSGGSLGNDMVGQVRVVFGSASGGKKARVGRRNKVKRTGEAGGKPYIYEHMELEGGFHEFKAHGTELAPAIYRESAKLRREGRLPADWEAHVEGQRIEELAGEARVGDDGLREIQAQLKDVGLTYDESLALSGALMGDTAPLVRASLMDEAARHMAVRGRHGSSVEQARQALDATVQGLKDGLPTDARFAAGHSLTVEDLYPRGGEAPAVVPKEVAVNALPDEAVSVSGHTFRQEGQVDVSQSGDLVATYKDGGRVDLVVGDNEVEAILYATNRGHAEVALDFARQQAEKMGKPLVSQPVDRMSEEMVKLWRKVEAKKQAVLKDGRFEQVMGATPITETTPLGPPGRVFHPRHPYESTWEAMERKIAKDGRTRTADDMLAMRENHLDSIRGAINDGKPVPLAVIHEARELSRGTMTGIAADQVHPGLGEAVHPTPHSLSKATVDFEWWDSEYSKARARQQPSSLSQAEVGARDASLMQKFTGQRPGKPRHIEIMDEVETLEALADGPLARGEVLASLPGEDGVRKLAVELEVGSKVFMSEEAVRVTRPREYHPKVVEDVQKILDLEDLEFQQSADYGAVASDVFRLDARRTAIIEQVQSMKDPPAAAIRQWDELTAALEEMRTKLAKTDAASDAARAKRVDASQKLRAALGTKGDDLPDSLPAEANEAARASDLDPEVVAREEGTPPHEALKEQDAAAADGWERGGQWGEQGYFDAEGRPRGPTNNPTMADVAEGRPNRDPAALIREVHEGHAVQNEFLSHWFVSPQTGFLNRLGMLGEQVSKFWMHSYQARQRFRDLGREMAHARQRTLRSKGDRYLAGRFLENDFDAIPETWVTEVMLGRSARAKAVSRYLDMYREATERTATHTRLPAFRRLNDYFTHLRDPQEVVKMLRDDLDGARKLGDADAIRKAEDQLSHWRDVQLKKLKMQNWEASDVPKGVYHGPLEQRLDQMADYIKDPEEVMKMVEQQAARFRQLDELLPSYKKLMDATSDPVTRKRIGEAQRLLFEPKSTGQQRLDRFILDNIVRPWVGPLVAKIPGNVVDRAAQMMRMFGFLMTLGVNPISSLVNLTSIPLHTTLRMGWSGPGDVARGTAGFLMDQVRAGNLTLFGQNMKKGKLPVSEFHELWRERMMGSVPKHWDMPADHGIDRLSKLQEWSDLAQEKTMHVAGFLFRSTESLNRGASFYTGAQRASRAVDHYQTHGTLRRAAGALDMTEFSFYDGFIAPRRESLFSELELMKKRSRQWEQHEQPSRNQYGVNEEPQGYPGKREAARVRGILEGPDGDWEKIRQLFDPEKRIREAIRKKKTHEMIGDIGTEAADETQFIYSKQNRPLSIVEGNAWAGTVLQFQDFVRSQLEFLGQRLPFFVKRQVAGKKRFVPGPGFVFIGGLWALGGPRAMPFIEYIAAAAATADPTMGDKFETNMDKMTHWRLPGGLPTNLAALGMDISASLRPGYNPPHQGEPYQGSSGLVRGLANYAGPAIGPVATAAGALNEATGLAGVLEDMGVPADAAATSAAGEQGLKLRAEDVPAEHFRFPYGLPLGKALLGDVGGLVSAANPGMPSDVLPDSVGKFKPLMAAANIPSKMAGLAGWKTGEEALAVREGRVPGTLDLPGDSLAGIIGMLKKQTQGAQNAHGTVRRRGKLITPISDFQSFMSEWTGLTPGKEHEVRREARSLGNLAKRSQKGLSALIDYTLENTPPSKGLEGEVRGSVGDIQNALLQNSGITVEPAAIHKRIMAKEHSLIVRQLAGLSKDVNKYFWEKEGIGRRLEEEADYAAEAGLPIAELGAKGAYISAARKFWSQTATELEWTKGGHWTSELRVALKRDAEKTRDPGIMKIRDDSMANFEMDGKTGKVVIDEEMEAIHEIARGGGSLGSKMARMRGKAFDMFPKDRLKQTTLTELGYWFLQQREGGDRNMRSDPFVEKLGEMRDAYRESQKVGSTMGTPGPAPEPGSLWDQVDKSGQRLPGARLVPSGADEVSEGGVAWLVYASGERTLIKDIQELGDLVKSGVPAEGEWHPALVDIMRKWKERNEGSAPQ